MWFRNPFPFFYSDGDFQIACDHYVGNATDLRNIANGGFNYVKSNDQSIEFYKFWYSSRYRYPGYHDQDVFNFIKHDSYTTDIGLTIKFLSTSYFGGICEPSKDLNKVCTMHANCCIGLQSKIHDLRIMMEDWRNYMSMPPSLKSFGALSWRVPQNCRCDASFHFSLIVVLKKIFCGSTKRSWSSAHEDKFLSFGIILMLFDLNFSLSLLST
jgi:hypothetical protein